MSESTRQMYKEGTVTFLIILCLSNWQCCRAYASLSEDVHHRKCPSHHDSQCQTSNFTVNDSCKEQPTQAFHSDYFHGSLTTAEYLSWINIHINNCDSNLPIDCSYHVYYKAPYSHNDYRVCVETIISTNANLHLPNHSVNLTTSATVALHCFPCSVANLCSPWPSLHIPAMISNPVNQSLLQQLSHRVQGAKCIFAYTAVYLFHEATFHSCPSASSHVFPCRHAALEFRVVRNYFSDLASNSTTCSPKPVPGVDLLHLQHGKVSELIMKPNVLQTLFWRFKKPRQCPVENESPVLLDTVIALRKFQGYPFQIPTATRGEEYQRHLLNTEAHSKLTLSLWFYLHGTEFCVAPFATEVQLRDHRERTGGLAQETEQMWESQEVNRRCSLITVFSHVRRSWGGPTLLLNDRGHIIVQTEVRRSTHDDLTNGTSFSALMEDFNMSDFKGVPTNGTAARSFGTLNKRTALNQWLHMTLTLNGPKYIVHIHNHHNQLLLATDFVSKDVIFSFRRYWPDPAVAFLGSVKQMFHSAQVYFSRLQVFRGRALSFHEIAHLVMTPPEFVPFHPQDEHLWRIANQRIENLLLAEYRNMFVTSLCSWENYLPVHFATSIRDALLHTSGNAEKNVFMLQSSLEQCTPEQDPDWRQDPWFSIVAPSLDQLLVHGTYTLPTTLEEMHSVVALTLFRGILHTIKTDTRHNWLRAPKLSHLLEDLQTAAYLGNEDALIMLTTWLSLDNTLMRKNSTHADRLLFYGALGGNRWAYLALGNQFYYGRTPDGLVSRQVNHAAAYLYYNAMLAQSQLDDVKHDDEDTVLRFVRLNEPGAIVEHAEMSDEAVRDWVQYNYEMGEEWATRYLSQNLFSGKAGFPRDSERAFQLLQEEVEGKGKNVSVEQEMNLAWMYLNGKGTPRNFARAETLLHRLALKGHRPAWNTLGWLYHNHYHNYSKAINYFTKAHNLGDPYGTYNLALQLAKDDPVMSLKLMQPIARSLLAVGTPLGEAYVLGVEGFSSSNFTLAADTVRYGAELNPKLSRWLNEGLTFYSKRQYLNSAVYYLTLNFMGLESSIFNLGYLCTEFDRAVLPLVGNTRNCKLDYFFSLLSRNSDSSRVTSYMLNLLGDFYFEQSLAEMRKSGAEDGDFMEQAVVLYVAAALRKSPRAHYNLGYLSEYGWTMSPGVTSVLLSATDTENMATLNSTDILWQLETAASFYRRCETLGLEDKNHRETEFDYLPCTFSLAWIACRRIWWKVQQIISLDILWPSNFLVILFILSGAVGIVIVRIGGILLRLTNHS